MHYKSMDTKPKITEKTITPQSEDNLISLSASAKRLGISVRGLYRLMANKDHALPPPVKVGGASRLFESDLNRYCDQLKAERERRYH